MNNLFLTVAAAGSLLVAGLAGCSQKAEVSRELDKAVQALDQPAPVQPSVVAAVPAQTVLKEQVPTESETPKQQMNQAVAAYKSGKLDDAVTLFQKLRASPALTPQQRMAIQDAMAAVMTDIYTLAAKGDARAQAAVKQCEEMQSAHRAQ